MFDIGFSELIVIGLVALIVIGPERMPTVARTIGALLGRAQRYMNDVKSEIRREMHVEDLKKFEERMKSEVQSVENSIHGNLRSIEDAAQGTVSEVAAVAAEASTLPGEASTLPVAANPTGSDPVKPA